MVRWGAVVGPEQLDAKPSAFLTLSIPPAERDSYYGLVAVADGYFRVFQTNGSPDYHRADPVVDEERGIVLVILRFGKADGVQNAAAVCRTRSPRAGTPAGTVPAAAGGAGCRRDSRACHVINVA